MPYALARFSVDRRLARELGRYLYQGLGDEDSHRVKVGAVGFETEALGLQRDRSSPAEGVQHRRRDASGGPHDLRPRHFQDALVVGVLPLDQLFQDAEEPTPLLLSSL